MGLLLGLDFEQLGCVDESLNWGGRNSIRRTLGNQKYGRELEGSLPLLLYQGTKSGWQVCVRACAYVRPCALLTVSPRGGGQTAF